jgi:Domain of unknown function (DUF4260)
VRRHEREVKRAPALWLVPDLAVLAWVSKDMPRDGCLAPRAVPLSNATHRLLDPAIVLTTSLLVGAVVLLGIGLTWLSHVLIDRALGYNLRTPDGYQRV